MGTLINDEMIVVLIIILNILICCVGDAVNMLLILRVLQVPIDSVIFGYD